VLSNLRKIQPNGGYGFGPRHLDFHPTKPWVYLSVERQSKLIVYKLQPNGDLNPEPLFTKETLGDPDHRIPVQGAGRFTFIPTASSSISATARASRRRWDRHRGRRRREGVQRRRSNIAAFAINPQTGEPTAFQHADIAPHIRARSAWIPPAG